eukprot:COSAG02_NODE_40605_length_403_cov_1.378289_1_plen_98_part_00
MQANIVQAGGLMLGGDYIAQRIEHNGRSGEGSAQLLPLHRVGIEAVQEKWAPAMQIGGGFWFVCNFCNFQFAPPSMRILIMSGQSLFWNTLLSLMQA